MGCHKKSKSLPYQRMMTSKYKFKYALDKENKESVASKTYGSCETYHNFYNNIFIKSKHLYEMIYTNHTTVYFDIDNLNYTKKEFDVFVVELTDKINNHFDITINPDDVKISCREEDDKNMVCSSHIIIDNTCVLQTDMKLFAILLNKTIPSIDIKVYHQWRVFKMPDMVKFSKTKYSRIYNSYTGSKYDEIRKHMINIYDTTDRVILKPKIVLEAEKKFDKVLFEDSVKKDIITFNDPNQIYNHLIENLTTDFFNNSADWKFATVLLCKLKLLENITEWCYLSSTKSKYKRWTVKSNKEFIEKIDVHITKCGIPKLCETVNKYLDIQVAYNQKVKITSSLCEYISSKINVSINIIQEILNTAIQNNSEADLITINEAEYKIKSGWLYFNKKYSNYYHDIELKEYSESSNTLKYDFQHKTIAEVLPYTKAFNSDVLKTLVVCARWGTGKSHHVMLPTIQHHKDTHRMIIITENNALNQKCKNDFNGLFKSHIDAQRGDSDDVNDINFTNDNIICSLESCDKIKMCKTKPTFLILDEFESIINHFESGKTVKDKYMTYGCLKKMIRISKCLLLDADISNNRIEWFKSVKEPIILHNVRTNKTTIEKLLNDLPKEDDEPHYAYYASANEDKDKRYEKEEIKFKTDTVIVDVTENAFKDYKFYLYNDFNYWIKNLYKSVETNHKRIAVGLTSRFKAKDLYEHFKQSKEEIKKNVLMITSDGINILINGEVTEEDNTSIKQNWLMNLEEYIKENKIDVFIYSPSIKTGISINSEIFDYIFAMGKNKSVCEREFNQMLFRNRKFKKKSFHIFINHHATSLKPYKTLEQIKTLYINNAVICKNDSIVKTNHISINDKDITHFDCDEKYLNMRATNFYEEYTSNKAFLQEFILRMKYTHGCNVIYRMEYDKDKTFKNDMIDNADTRKQKELEELLQCQFISDEQFEKIRDKMKSQTENKKSISNTDRLLYRKHNLFKWLNIYQIKSQFSKRQLEEDKIPFSVLQEPNNASFQYILLDKFTSYKYKDRFDKLQNVIYDDNFDILRNTNDKPKEPKEVTEDESKEEEEEEDDCINDDNREPNDFICNSSTVRNRDILIKKIYKTLPIDTELTNTEFNAFINGDVFQNLTQDLLIPYLNNLDIADTYKLLCSHSRENKFDKKETTLIFKCLNRLLNLVNYNIRYIYNAGNHSTHPNDKLIISQVKNSVFTLPKKIKPIDTNRDFKQDNIIKKQSYVSIYNYKLGGGYVYREIDEILQYSKTGKLKKATIKNVLVEFKVYKTDCNTYRPYETIHNKSLDKMIKQIETNNTKNVSYKEIYTDCLLDMMFYIYNPRIVHKLVVAEDKKTCNIVEQNDDGFEIVKCGVKEKQEYYESLKFERNVYVARNYKKYNANKNRL